MGLKDKTTVKHIGKLALSVIIVMMIFLPQACNKKTASAESGKPKTHRKFKCKCNKPKTFSYKPISTSNNKNQPVINNTDKS